MIKFKIYIDEFFYLITKIQNNKLYRDDYNSIDPKYFDF